MTLAGFELTIIQAIKWKRVYSLSHHDSMIVVDFYIFSNILVKKLCNFTQKCT
jgi:hypothetical protein